MDLEIPPSKKPRLCEDSPNDLTNNTSAILPKKAPLESTLVDTQKEGACKETYTREEEVGITQYISSHPSIFAILKQRYSDFVVHELALDGSLVQLTEYSLPNDPPPPTSVALEDVFSAPDVAKLQSLSEKDGGKDTVQITLDADVSKDQRTSMHQAIREHYPMLESRTEDGGRGDKLLIIQHSTNIKRSSGKRSKWPQGRGDYCQFVLHKENKDTMEAISLISRILKIKSSAFHYAGTKDRRAITSQLVTAFRVPAEKLITLNDKCKNINAGNFRYVSEQLRLGSLSGNRFSIILRRLSCDDHVIQASLSSLKEHGFVNYFGMQRFGTSVVPTHTIGRCLIHSNWEGAIEIILKPRPGDSQEVNEAREYYASTKDATGALKRMPKWKAIECQLLQGLERHGEKRNYLGALNFIPRNTRLMYVHSWQSFIWNKVISWRLQRYGFSPQVGDVVWKEQRSKGHNSKSEVKIITQEVLSEYSIHDVLLPLPGFDVRFPENEAKDEYVRQLSEDGVSIDQLEHRVKEFALPGSYRNVVTKPSDVTWELLHYDDVTEPLILTDVDVMNSKAPPISISGAKYKALKVDFGLPSSTYATMALREVLKMDTSSAHQTTLNDENGQ